MIGRREVEGFDALTIASPGSDGIELTLVPDAGMVCCSLTHRGEELLGQRGGLRKYVDERSTMGIPLLHPWANRVSELRFEVADRKVDLADHSELISLNNGLPIHGLLAGAGGWAVERHEEIQGGAVLAAAFDFASHHELIEAFPFPHRLGIETRVSEGTLEVATTVEATGDAPVPVSLGYHPYFVLPDIARSSWEVELPVSRRLVLDDQMLPTGALEEAAIDGGPLESRTFDDAFLAPEDGAPFVLEGGGRRIQVSFRDGYPYSQVYAPEDDDVIAFEPMTAPTNALVSGQDLRLLEPGGSYAASFSITVTSL
jgi:aldose 1-epimerase